MIDYRHESLPNLAMVAQQIRLTATSGCHVHHQGYVLAPPISPQCALGPHPTTRHESGSSPIASVQVPRAVAEHNHTAPRQTFAGRAVGPMPSCQRDANRDRVPTFELVRWTICQSS